MAVLPPTHPVAVRIREAAGRGTLSHALLFTGPGDRLAAARFAAAALECQGTDRPCGVCPACRKVLSEIHPDVTVVRDEAHKNVAVEVVRAVRADAYIQPNEGARKVYLFPDFSEIHPDVTVVRDEAHKNVAVEVVRAVRADAYIQPNEGARKVYLFPDCALLTEQDQNVLLKVVEEGPPYAAFLFCAENPSQVLQTLRSRCVELKLPPAEETASGSSDLGEELCRRIGSRRRGAVTEFAAGLERKRPDREALAAMLDRGRQAFAQTLLLLYGRQPPENDREIPVFLAKNLTKAQIMSTIEVLETYHGECAYNVGVGHVLGALAAELEGIL